LVLAVIVHVSDSRLNRLLAHRRQPSSVPDVVAYDVIDMLEFLSYVETVIVSR
jgi:hypothetical protein